jgi:P4 family phage/plasmid primase-like protien
MSTVNTPAKPNIVINPKTSVVKMQTNVLHYLNSYRYDKSKHPIITNTRIKDAEKGISGGCFYIPPEEYPQFLKVYYNDILKNGRKEYLTEKQLDKNAPILVDLDLRFDPSVKTRQYTKGHIDDLIDLYLGILKDEMYQFDEDTNFPIYVLEKDNVNCLSDKTKDGIHIIFGIQTDRITQILLRKKIISKIADCWDDLPITNTWDDVFDHRITTGDANWQLFGSCKPNHETYKLTSVYNITYNPEDQSFSMDTIDLKKFNIGENIYKLSARYDSHYSPFMMRNEFIAEYEKMNGASGGPAVMKARSSNVAASSQNVFLMNAALTSSAAFVNIANKDQLTAAIECFLDAAESNNEHETREIHDYVMTLPPSYYGDGSYSKWIRVGWCLRNMDPRYFIIWIAFSAQASNFDFGSIPELYTKWEKMRMSEEFKGLTKRSLMYWSKQDAYDKYMKVRVSTIDYYIESTIDTFMALLASSDKNDKKPVGCTETALAEVLYQLKKDQFVCVSVRDNIWYQFKNHYWQIIDSGTTLRSAISGELLNLYFKKAQAIQEQSIQLPEDDKRVESMRNRVDKIMTIVNRLGKTSEKKNIMIEAKDKFYDSEFLRQLDTNPWLMCFNNGVWDFKEGVFRDGRPDDFISLTTRIDYIKIDHKKDEKEIQEMKLFMQQLFPIPELERYMWEHLASTLIGTSANQTFNNYIGEGSNGKSVLTSLMSMILGDYSGELSGAAITQERTKIGGLAPEIVGLRGKRYVVIQETNKKEAINEGIMKQYTSGIEPIIARAPYMITPLHFIPQFKLVVCANQFLKVNSNDHGTWRRIRVPRFLSLFTNNPVNDDPDKPYQFKLIPELEKKFEDKLKYIFMGMLVEIALEKKGLVQDCPTVLAASEAYRQSQDVVSEFINEKIVPMQGASIKKTALNFEFQQWHLNTYGKNGPQPKEVHTYMDKKYGKATSKGWMNVKIKQDNEIDMDEDEASINDSDVEDIHF